MAGLKAGLASVIIPTRNRGSLVLDAIDSAKRQTWPNTEIIVIDDGSEDDTCARVAGIPGVRYLRQERSGQGAARNLGLLHARGDYIAPLDSDDLWGPVFLERAIQAMEDLQADIVFCNWHTLALDRSRDATLERDQTYRWQRYPATRLNRWRAVFPSVFRKMVLDGCLCPSSGLLLRRSSMGPVKWSEKMLVADDQCLLLDLALQRSSRLGIIIEPLWTKRVQADSISCGKDFSSGWVHQCVVQDFRHLKARFGPLLDGSERHRLEVQAMVSHLGYARRLLRKPSSRRTGMKTALDALTKRPVCTAKALWMYIFMRFRRLVYRLQDRTGDNGRCV